MKFCPHCGEESPNDQFYKRSGRSDSLQSWCIECTKELRRNNKVYQAKMAKEKRAKLGTAGQRDRREYQLQYHFDITSEEYESILRSQGGVCAICSKPDGQDLHSSNRFKRLSVDHDHDTGMVRGLLCSNCNRAVGYLQDSPANARRATEYLEKHARDFEIAVSLGDQLLAELEK